MQNTAPQKVNSFVKRKKRFERLEVLRIQEKITQRDLCMAAQVGLTTYHNFVNCGQAPSPRVLDRLERALNQRRMAIAPPIIAGLHRTAMALLAVELAGSLRSVLKNPPKGRLKRAWLREAVMSADFSVERPRNPAWLAASHVRRLAIYVLAVEVGVPRNAIAAAVGCTKQNVSQAITDGENARDEDPTITRAIERVSLCLRPV